MPNATSARAGWSLLELLVVIGILATLSALILPAVQSARNTAARASCSNNLHQIGLGANHYHSSHGHFPNGIVTSSKQPGDMLYLSWLARLLPHVEQEALWRQALAGCAQFPGDFTMPPHPLGISIKTYSCPADSRTSEPQLARGRHIVGLTSYMGMAGHRNTRGDGVIFANSGVRHADILDGSSNTILAGERPPSQDFWYGWWYAGVGSNFHGTADMVLGAEERTPFNDAYVPDCGPKPGGFKPGDLSTLCSAFHYWSRHSGGGNFAFADGSVRFLNYSAASIFVALATRAGGESVAAP